MLEQASHLLSGYVRFRLIGNSSRFMTLAARSGIRLWGFQKKDGAFYACIKAREYKKLRPLSRRCQTKMRCVGKYGFPFYVRKALKRKGMLLGAMLFVFLYTFLSGFVWDVQVSGIDTITEAEVLTAARACGVYEGGSKDGFTPRGAAQSIMRQVEGISWISVNTDHCMVTIEIKEAEKKPEITNEETPSNIVANRAGMILRIEAQSGMVKVRPGDIVRQGDTLVTGIYTDQVDEYTVREAPLQTTMVPSRASVIAETAREFRVEVSAEKHVTVDTGEQENRYLLFFGMKIPLGLNTAPSGEYRTYHNREMLTLLQKELPVGVVTEKYVYTRQQSVTLSEEQLRQEALFALRQQQEESLPEHSKIISEELEYTFTDRGCVLTARCVCEEEIGVTQEILVESSTGE